MEFLEVLERAWADVQAAKIPPELYDTAFKEALKHYTGQVTAAVSAAAPAAFDPSTNRGEASSRGAPDGVFAALAVETATPREQLEEVFYFAADGSPALNIPARRLGKSNAERTRAIALLIASVRHFGMDEMEITVDDVRLMCSDMNVYDSNNFSTYVASVPGLILSGPRGSKVFRVKPDAKSKFKQKVAEIVGAADVEE